jgi:serine/threonine protein kinase
MAVGTTGRPFAGRYRTIRRLGAGGMATVFLAEDERLGRRVAVKRLHGDIADEDLARRFQREARLGASLNHPNVVTIYDIVSDEEGVLIVMEYVEGHTLRDEIANGPVVPERALPVLRGVADALDHAHEHGVVHRDVKPANVLVRRDGTAKLADLGIATAAEQSRITRSGNVLGTAAYMAPERLDGGSGDPSVDVYALAAVAYEALSGRKAVEGATPLEVAQRVINQEPPDLVEALPDAPPGAAAALRRGLAKVPAERPASAGELVDRLWNAYGLAADAVPTAATVPLAEPEPVAEPEPEAMKPAPVVPASVLPPAHPEPVVEHREPPPEPPPSIHSPARRRAPVGPIAGLLAALLVAAVVIALVAGGGSDEPKQKAFQGRKADKKKASSGGSASAATAGGSAAPAAGGPAGAVNSFYQHAARHEYDAAWALATPRLRSQLGGLRSFEAGQSTLRSIRFPVLRTESSTATAATVQLQSEARHVARVDRVCGTVDLVRAGGAWMLDQLHLDTCPGAASAQSTQTGAGRPGKGRKPGKGPKAEKVKGSDGGE